MRLSDHKTLIVTGIVTIIFIIIVMTLVIPSMKEIRRLNAEILSRRIQLERLYKQGQSTRRVANDLELVAPQIPRIERAFLHFGEELDFITTIEKLAKKNALMHTLDFSVNQQEKVQKGAIEYISITLSLAGTYKNLYRYLVEFDSLPHYVGVQKLTISGGERDLFLRQGGKSSAPLEDLLFSDNQVVSAQIEALTYWREK